MSAVFDDVKSKAIRRQAGGFAATQTDDVTAEFEMSLSTVERHVGAVDDRYAFMIYVPHVDPHEIGGRAKVFRVPRGNVFPVLGETLTSTMSIGGSWVASDVDVFSSGVVSLPWKRKVIYSGRVQLKLAQLPKRKPRTIIGDHFADEGND